MSCGWEGPSLGGQRSLFFSSFGGGWGWGWWNIKRFKRVLRCFLLVAFRGVVSLGVVLRYSNLLIFSASASCCAMLVFLNIIFNRQWISCQLADSVGAAMMSPTRGMDGTVRAFNVSQPWDNELSEAQLGETGNLETLRRRKCTFAVAHTFHGQKEGSCLTRCFFARECGPVFVVGDTLTHGRYLHEPCVNSRNHLFSGSLRFLDSPRFGDFPKQPSCHSEVPWCAAPAERQCGRLLFRCHSRVGVELRQLRDQGGKFSSGKPRVSLSTDRLADPGFSTGLNVQNQWQPLFSSILSNNQP